MSAGLATLSGTLSQPTTLSAGLAHLSRIERRFSNPFRDSSTADAARRVSTQFAQQTGKRCTQCTLDKEGGAGSARSPHYKAVRSFLVVDAMFANSRAQKHSHREIYISHIKKHLDRSGDGEPTRMHGRSRYVGSASCGHRQKGEMHI